LPLAHQVHERHVKALFEQFARFYRADAPAYVRHVGGRGCESDQTLLVEDRLDETEVIEVAGSDPGVVGDVDVTRLHIGGTEAFDRRLYRGRQGADERWDAAAVLDHRTALAVRQHHREVIRLGG